MGLLGAFILDFRLRILHAIVFHRAVKHRRGFCVVGKKYISKQKQTVFLWRDKNCASDASIMKHDLYSVKSESFRDNYITKFISFTVLRNNTVLEYAKSRTDESNKTQGVKLDSRLRYYQWYDRSNERSRRWNKLLTKWRRDTFTSR